MIDAMEKILKKGNTVVNFSGTQTEMDAFFNAFPSISDLVPYQHIQIPSPSKVELLEIFGMMAREQGQIIQEGALKPVKSMLKQIDPATLKKNNVRCVERLLKKSMQIRDARISAPLNRIEQLIDDEVLDPDVLIIHGDYEHYRYD